MGRPKGKANKPNRSWPTDEKERIVLRVINCENSLSKISQEEKINPGQLHLWVNKYLKEGKKGLITKKKPGNPYKGLNLKKELTDIEKLEYENMKLRIENERLKKGYLVEGDGQIVVFNGLKNKNLK